MVAQTFGAWQGMLATHFQSLGPKAAAEFASLLLTGIEGAYVRARRAFGRRLPRSGPLAVPAGAPAPAALQALTITSKPP